MALLSFNDSSQCIRDGLCLVQTEQPVKEKGLNEREKKGLNEPSPVL